MKATFDPAKNLDLYFRKGRNGSKVFNFYNTDGSDHDLTGQEFEFKAPFNVSVSVDSNTITFEFSEEEVIKRDNYFWQLVNKTESRTWLCGTAFFTSDLSANINDTEDIIININGETINITISSPGSSLENWDMSTDLFPSGSTKGKEYYGINGPTSTLLDCNGDVIPDGVILKSIVSNASTTNPAEWAILYTIK